VENYLHTIGALFRVSFRSLAHLGKGLRRVHEGRIWDTGLGYHYCIQSSKSDGGVYTALVFNQPTGVILAAHVEAHFLVIEIYLTHKRCTFERSRYHVSRCPTPFVLIHIVISSYTSANFPPSPLPLLLIPFLITPIKFRKWNVECFSPF